MRTFFKKILAASVAVCVPVLCASCGDNSTEAAIKIFKNNEKISYCGTYRELSESKTNEPEAWREGMISGNGEQGFVTSGAPYSDSMIFQNVGFVMPPRPAAAGEEDGAEKSPPLSEAKRKTAEGEEVPFAQGTNAGAYHPGGALRIKSVRGNPRKYIRYTDYSTGEVSVSFSDENGAQLRRSFTSMADPAVFTQIVSESGDKLDLSLSFDDLSVFAGFGEGAEKDCLVKRITDPAGEYLAFLGHYPDYEGSDRAADGWLTLTRVIVDGGSCGLFPLTKNEETAQDVSDEVFAVRVSDAYAVYLITVSVPLEGLCDYDAFAAMDDRPAIAPTLRTIRQLERKYRTEGYFDFDAALKAHKAVYEADFGAVTLTLGGVSGLRSNEQLRRDVKKAANENRIDPSALLRSYYAGRFALLCGGGRSCGLWTGEFGDGNGVYELQDDRSLQTAGLAAANLPDTARRYALWVLRNAGQWQTNALRTHRTENALQAFASTDGVSPAYGESPYWNAGAALLLRPLYEAVISGALTELSAEDLPEAEPLAQLLSWTDEPLTEEQLEALSSFEAVSVEKQILLPLLIKAAEYWRGMVDPAFYTDADGAVHYQKGKASLNKGETYALLPGGAPGDQTAGANRAIDIAACRDTLSRLLAVLDRVAAADSAAAGGDRDPLRVPLDEIDRAAYLALLRDLPPVRIDAEAGGLAGLYPLWPTDGAALGEEQRAAALDSLSAVKKETLPAAAALSALYAARLGDREAFTGALQRVYAADARSVSLLPVGADVSDGIRPAALTLFAAAVNEALLRSSPDRIELLPCPSLSGMGSGSISGVRTLSGATVTLMSWDLGARYVIADITAGDDVTLTVSSPLSTEALSLELSEGETRTVTIDLDLLPETGVGETDVSLAAPNAAAEKTDPADAAPSEGPADGAGDEKNGDGSGDYGYEDSGDYGYDDYDSDDYDDDSFDEDDGGPGWDDGEDEDGHDRNEDGENER